MRTRSRRWCAAWHRVPNNAGDRKVPGEIFWQSYAKFGPDYGDDATV